MAPKRFFLVAKQDPDGTWHRASQTGFHVNGVVVHPLVLGMTRHAHKEIRGAVAEMAQDTAIRSVDLTADGNWRVSWM